MFLCQLKVCRMEEINFAMVKSFSDFNVVPVKCIMAYFPINKIIRECFD